MSNAENQDNKPFELRFYLTQSFADAVRAGKSDPGLRPLYDILDRHGASIDHSQFDDFSDFVTKHRLITDWEAAYPDEKARKFHRELMEFTEKTLADSAKAAYLSREFTVSVRGKKSFQDAEADALIEDLNTLEDSGILGVNPPRQERAVCRKVFFPARHPGTTG